MTWPQAKAEAARILADLRGKHPPTTIRLIIRALSREHRRTINYGFTHSRAWMRNYTAESKRRGSVGPADEPFKAMEESIKAGVQIIVAHQLFPTPKELAERMTELAGKPVMPSDFQEAK